jgi:hypothetical protein
VREPSWGVYRIGEGVDCALLGWVEWRVGVLIKWLKAGCRVRSCG